LRVLDGAVAIFSAVDGVEPQSETVWHQADRYGVPRVAFINKMDRIGSDWKMVLDMMREKLAVTPIPFQIPIGSEDTFSGVIDLLSEKSILFSDEDQGATVLSGEIPSELIGEVQSMREAVIEAAADMDDELAEKFLEGQEITRDELISCLRKGVIAQKFVPVFIGSGLKNKGIQPLLDAVVDLLPSPLDVPNILGVDPKSGEKLQRDTNEDEPLSALAFKVQMDQGRKLTYLRIYSGKIKAGDTVYNPRLQKPEKIARLLKMHANKRERIDESVAGDIVATMGLKESTTGDTLCDKNNQILYESIFFNDPVISLAIEPKTVADQGKLEQSLQRLVEEDPTLTVKQNEDTGQTIISGMGELHLEIMVDRLRREFNVDANVGKPQVVYRETITQSAKAEGVIDREIAGEARFAGVTLSLAPLKRGSGLSVISDLSTDGDSAVDPEWVESAIRSIRDTSTTGPLMGYPLVDVEIKIVSANIKEGLTDEMAFAIASGMALREGAQNGKPILLEPIMDVEIITPEEFMGEIIGDINVRGGHLKGVDVKGNVNQIQADVSLSKMFGYSTALRSQSQGRATFTMQFSRYDRMEDTP